MAVSGEATVGHIIGFLRLDADQYFRTLEAADAAADKLGSRKVNVKATASTGKARSELDSLGRSVDRVDGAQKRATASSNKLGAAHQRNGRHMRALVVTALSLGPALGPLAATTIGLAGALTTMGAAGIVAIVGVKREIEEGTTLGAAFVKTIDVLKRDFDGLASTGANSALAPFNDIVREVTERMPFLNRSVSTFTNLLGSGSTNALTGVLDSLATMEPLLVSAGIWVDKLLAKFAATAAGGGLKAFTDYARSTLPLVTDTLENLVVAVVDLIRAFAPMGAGVLQVIHDVSAVISGMPVGVLTALASAAAAGFLGFQAWRGITAIVNGVVGALTFMNTKMVVSASLARGLSLATAGVGVAIAAATFFYARHAEAARKDQAAVDSLTDALIRSKGELTEDIRLDAFKSLQESGAIDAARELGINLGLVTEAAMGSVPASQAVARQMAAIAAAAPGAGKNTAVVTDSLSKLAAGLGNSTGHMVEAIQGQKDWAQASRETAPVLDEATRALNRQASVYDVTGAALKTFEGNQKAAADASDAAREKMILESDAAGMLKDALDKLNGKAQTEAGSENSYQRARQALAEQGKRAADEVKAAKKDVKSAQDWLAGAKKTGDKSGIASAQDALTDAKKRLSEATKNDTRAVEGNSEAAVDNREKLLRSVDTIEARAQATADATQSSEKGVAKFKALRDELIKDAIAAGMSAEEVKRFLGEVAKVPTSIPPTKIDVDTARATQKTTEFQQMINGLTGKTVMVSVYTTEHIQQLRDAGKVSTANAATTANQYATGKAYTSGKAPAYQTSRKDGVANANGNIFKAFANGGVESHIAQMAPAGAMRLWAEPETGGESYIPHAKGKRARSLEIWEETGRILGADKQSNSVSITHNGNIVTESPAGYQAQMEAIARRKALTEVY